MSDLHPKILEVLERIKLRSKNSRTTYLASIDEMDKDKDQDRAVVSCSNIAHAGAAAGVDQKIFLLVISPILELSPLIMICFQLISHLRHFQP
ncbi:MAG: hypothetical protein CM15mP117_24460 [Alphaproteobacteria bacterium]|nr:MAG: hypothetical protein CM15mP117_24460 [Alphaproteobacteria bacterium]